MTWYGDFDENGRPVIGASVKVFNFVGWVNFLVDTGADTSMLGWSDMRNFRIDPHGLLGTIGETHGVNASMDVNTVEANIRILNPVSGRVKEIGVGLDLPLGPQPRAPDGRLLAVPSLLGQDFLSHFKFTHDSRSRLVMFEE